MPETCAGEQWQILDGKDSQRLLPCDKAHGLVSQLLIAGKIEAGQACEEGEVHHPGILPTAILHGEALEAGEKLQGCQTAHVSIAVQDELCQAPTAVPVAECVPGTGVCDASASKGTLRRFLAAQCNADLIACLQDKRTNAAARGLVRYIALSEVLC